MLCRGIISYSVEGANIQYRGGVDVLRIHHVGHSLQRAEDHGLLPLLQILELSDEAFLQWPWCIHQRFVCLFRQVNVNLALVTAATLSDNVTTG